MQDPPDGFVPYDTGGDYIAINGPIYARVDGRGAAFGFRVEPRHCNPLGICHGGWLATMADMVMPLAARHAAGEDEQQMLLTVSMALDYFGQATIGAWVEGRAETLRRTKRLVFSQAMLRIEGEAILRASGVFRIGPPLRLPPLGV